MPFMTMMLPRATGSSMPKRIAQQEEPDGDVQHAQAHHGEAHDGAGGEGHPQALVQALGGGLGGTGVGVGGDLHADEARQHGPDARRRKEGGEVCLGGEGEEAKHKNPPPNLFPRVLCGGGGGGPPREGFPSFFFQKTSCPAGPAKAEPMPRRQNRSKTGFPFSSLLIWFLLSSAFLF